MPTNLDKATLTILRFALCGWVGAAVLYVATSVAEQVSPLFDSTIRDQLATIRFPFFYGTGFILQTTAILSAGYLSFKGVFISRARIKLILALVAIGLIGFAYDYIFIYQPLLDEITPAGKPRTEAFTTLHAWSRHINEVNLLLLFTASVAAAIPFGTTPKNDA